MYNPKIADSAVQPRIRLEQRIVRKAVKALLAAGYALATEQGEHRFYGPSRPSLKASEVLADCCETDEEYLGVFKAEQANGTTYHVQPLGYVYFVYGNDGWDVISDYTTNLEPVLQPVLDYANAQA